MNWEKNKILVVDDEADFAFFLKSNLELTQKYTVDTASSGQEALSKYARAKPDLVLLDVMMPGMSGIEVLEKLDRKRQDGGQIPVVMLSAKRDSASILDAQKCGAAEYLMKPMEIDKLSVVLDKFLP